MYGVVLMMALSNGPATPSVDAVATPSTGHYAYRGGRGGCCGCNGGGHHRGGHGHGCCGNNHGCCGYNYGGCCGYANYCGCCGNVNYCGCYGDGHAPGHAPAAPAPAKDTKKAAQVTGDDSGTMNTMAPATIVVNLPAEAVLSIDDQPTASTSETRKFVTPELSQTGEYHYTLSAEITRDGQKLTTSKQVVVSGGKEIEVSLEFPTAVAQR